MSKTTPFDELDILGEFTAEEVTIIRPPQPPPEFEPDDDDDVIPPPPPPDTNEAEWNDPDDEGGSPEGSEEGEIGRAHV